MMQLNSARSCVCVLVLLLAPLLASAAIHEISFAQGPIGSSFGYAVDVDGDDAVISGYLFDNGGNADVGKVFFWRRSATGAWSEVASFLSPDVSADNARFSMDVAISGAYAAVATQYVDGGVGADEGAVYMYKNTAGTWAFSRKIKAPVPGSYDHFANEVQLGGGNTLVVGSPYHETSTTVNTNRGIVFIYERADGSDDWTFSAQFEGASNNDLLGFGAAVAGDYAFGGARNGDGSSVTDSGIVYVYRRTAPSTWSLVQTIGSPNAVANGHFGTDMSASGDRLIVGATGEGIGNAYIYVRNGSGVYELQATIASSDPNVTQAAQRVSISGDFASISNTGNSETTNVGSLEVYRRSLVGAWSLYQTLTGSGLGSNAGFGLDNSISNGRFVTGSASTDRVFFHEEQPANPLRCGEYDAANERYFYDDGTGCESAPTVADACYFSAGDLVTTDAATLRVDLSELKADGGEDYIYLAFDLADKYYNNQLVFADAQEGECEHADWEQVSATRNVTSLDACETTYVYRLAWSDAYNATGSKCGWERDGSGANVKLVLDFTVRADEDLSTMRNGTTISREVEFSMPVQVEFPTQVTASPVNVTVFAPVRVLAAVTSQTVTIDEAAVEATLTLELLTEVQKPFELHAITETTGTMPTGVTLETTMSDGVVRQDAECDDTAADCANTWRWQYSTPSVAGGSNPCDFDGTYQVTFGVRCSEVSNTNCPIDSSTDSVELTLTVSTSNHCPTVIDSVDLNAALVVYDLPARADAQDDFVGDGTQDDGQAADLNDWQVAYFAAPVTSTQVAIQRTEFNQVWIVRHQETVSAADDDVVVLLDADDTINESPYDGVGEIDCGVVAGVGGADATATAVSAATGCSPSKDGVGGTYSFNFKHGEGGNSEAGQPSTPIFEFDVRTDAAGFDMADDAIETMQVNAVIDVEYANAAKRTGGAVQNNAQQSTVTSSFSMQTTRSTTGSSGSTALFGMNATVLYGAGAFLVVGVLAVLVVVSRRRSGQAGKMEKMQSTAEMTAAAV